MGGDTPGGDNSGENIPGSGEVSDTYTLKLIPGEGLMGFGAMVQESASDEVPETVELYMVNGGNVMHSTDPNMEAIEVVREGEYTTLPTEYTLEMQIPAGKFVIIVAMAADGYTFDKWSADVGDNNLETSEYYCQFTMPELDIIATANAIMPLKLTLNVPDITYSETYTVSGVVSNAENGVKSVMVNGIEATVQSDGSYSAKIELSGNTVTATATDNSGKTITETVTYETRAIDSDDLSHIGYTGEENESLVIPTTYMRYNTYYKVTGIGTSAFSSCTNLSSIVIPDVVTSIGQSAFRGCTSLTSITIPSSVTTIGSSAFYGAGLTNVTIPNSVTSIGEYAFFRCANLLSVTITNSVTNIGNSAFSYSGLTSVNIPSSITNIGNQLFVFCEKLESATIPNSIKNIDSNAFRGCINLSSITIPNSVTSIGGSAFSGSGLTDITIPSSITNIEDWTFMDCANLKSVTIPNSVTSIGNSAFSGTGLTSVTIPNSITSIGSSVFSESNLISVTIPSSIASISERAFNDCVSLTSVIIPNSVTSIGFAAFSGCTSLKSIDIPDTVTSIDNSAFSGSGLTSIIIPSSITCINVGVFNSCENLTSITIPSSVTSIYNNAFFLCTNLTSVTFENTTGWKVSENSAEDVGVTPLSSADLANKSIAATYLTTTYPAYNLFRD